MFLLLLSFNPPVSAMSRENEALLNTALQSSARELKALRPAKKERRSVLGASRFNLGERVSVQRPTNLVRE